MVKLALISPNEIQEYKTPTGESIACYRVAQVEESGSEFPVAEPLAWIPCDDFVVANDYVYDPETQQFYDKRTVELEQPSASGGIETL